MEKNKVNTIVVKNPPVEVREFIKKVQEQKAEHRKRILEQKSYTFTINV